MSQHSSYHETGLGTAGGTLLVLLARIHVGDILQTAILAAIGASVSFLVTLFWKRFSDKRRNGP